MIGPIILAGSVIALLIGFVVVTWDWTVLSNPDAPHGGPIVIIAIVGLLCGGVVSCTETMAAVEKLRAQQTEAR